MQIARDVAEAVFNTGDYLELLRLAGQTPAQRAVLDPSTRILVAHALASIERTDEAKQLALSTSAEGRSALLQSRSEIVLGMVCEFDGDSQGAIHHYHAAIKAAEESDDSEQIAWSHLKLFRSLIDGHPIESLRATLGHARRAVIAAGRPDVSACLHTCVAALEGHTGRIDEALRHCEVADSLLVLSPNLWVQSIAMVNRACIASVLWDFKEATRLFKSARDIAVRCGHARTEAVCDINLGHLEGLLGHWSAATKYLVQVGRSPRSALASIAASDTLAQIELARGHLDDCQRILAQLNRVIERHPHLATTNNARWSIVTKIRLLIQSGRWEDAQLLVLETVKTAETQGDLPLLATLHFLSSQLLAETGDTRGAAVCVLAAAQNQATRLPELHPQFDYAVASGCRPGTALRDQLLRRAHRIWSHHGIVLTPMQMGGRMDRPKPTESAPDIAAIVNGAASLFDVAHTPRLLADEVRDLIARLQCCPDLDVAKSRNGDTPVVARHGWLATALGRDRTGSSFSVLCEVPSDTEGAAVLSSVMRLVEAARALQQFKDEERNRAALWPADPIETEAGAFFVAEEMQTLLTTARRIAPTTVPVLITGETGTGKEVLARLIHAYSNRAKATFLPFNCSAVPKDMLDSQLFGHRRGSFTGAADNFAGVIRAAAQGTLLLDEIGETTLDVQPKLLRFLESGEVHPIGELQPVRVDVRVIAATNAELDTLVAQGRFREDLFYRLNIVRLHVPPLRERRVEIPTLANHYLRKHGHEYGKGDLRLAEETMEYLVLYRWPGNVRQLANEMRRMAALAESGAVLMPEHLSAEIAASRKTIPASERTLEPTEVVVRLDQPIAAAVQHVERALILHALKQTGANMEETASVLGLSRKGLYLKRQRYGIEAPGERNAAAVA